MISHPFGAKNPFWNVRAHYPKRIWDPGNVITAYKTFVSAKLPVRVVVVFTRFLSQEVSRNLSITVTKVNKMD